MESYKQVYQEMISLLTDSKSIDPKMFDYGMCFRSKMFSFEMMYRKTLKYIKELEEIYKKENAQGKILLEETGRAWNKSVAFFEAYLNAFYSLLQIIAKITPYFYGNEKSKIFPSSTYFGRLIDYLKKHPNIDTDFSSYLNQRVRWYETLRNNRHMITHEGSAFLGFGQDGKIVFVDYPKKGFSWFQPNKSTKDLESYLTQSFADLFDFLDFYVKHFRQRVKST
jgi:hypothetical protein